MHGGTNDLCVEEFSMGESSATRTLARNAGMGSFAVPSCFPRTFR
jgi:hypothetical protein